MSESGLGAFGAYMLGRYSAESSERIVRQARNFFSPRVKMVSEADYNEAAILAHRAVEYVQVLDARLEKAKADIQLGLHKSSCLEQQLAAAKAANDELKRQLEAEKAHGVMLDDRLFDLTMRHARLCKKTNTKDS